MEWISVKDRMPIEISNGSYKTLDCLVSDGFRVCICQCQTGPMPKPWINWSDYSDIPSNMIKFWMAIPKAPRNLK